MPNGYLFKWFEYEDLGTWASPCLLHGNLGRHCAVLVLNMVFTGDEVFVGTVYTHPQYEF